MKHRIFACARVFISVLVAVAIVAPQSVFAAIYTADPGAGSQWHLDAASVRDAWAITRGSPDLVVAVIDTGVDIDNPDLRDNIWTNPNDNVLDGRDNDSNGYPDDVNGWNFIEGTNDVRPDIVATDARTQAIHHGTLVASIIAAVADNGVAGVGIAPRVKIMPLRVLDSTGQGSVRQVVEALRYAIDKRVDVINLSFVGDQGFERSLYLAIRDAYNAGILVVAATGNEASGGKNLDNGKIYPVCFQGENGEDIILGVTALDRNNHIARFANYGTACTDLSAPGVDMYGSLLYRPTAGFDQISAGGWSGTSLATPIVAGAALLVKSVNPRYQAADIRDVLLQSAESVDFLNPGVEGKIGAGKVNVARAVELARGGSIKPRSNSHQAYVMVAPQSADGSVVRVLRYSGTEVVKFDAYAPRFKYGVRLAHGDLGADGHDEIVTAPGPGTTPEVKIFGSDGVQALAFMAYDKSFRGGVNVAVGNIDASGSGKIITAPGAGGGPQIKIFNNEGKMISSFWAYDKSFRGGVNVATGDVNGDGKDEIIVAPGPGRETRVRVFYANGREAFSFNAFPRSVVQGVNVAVGDLDGNGRDEIVVAPMKSAVPEVRVYSNMGEWQRAFMAYDAKFKGGVNLSILDADGDGKNDIVTGPGAGGGPHVRMFDEFGRLKQEFFPFDAKFTGGVIVSGVIL